MSRVKRGMATKKRHKRLLNQAKGFWGQRKNIFKRAHETLLRAWAFAFKSRKMYKRDMRSLIYFSYYSSVSPHGTSYSKFIHGLKIANVALNRKMLSQLSIFEPDAFSKIVEIAKQ